MTDSLRHFTKRNVMRLLYDLELPFLKVPRPDLSKPLEEFLQASYKTLLAFEKAANHIKSELPGARVYVASQADIDDECLDDYIDITERRYEQRERVEGPSVPYPVDDAEEVEPFQQETHKQLEKDVERALRRLRLRSTVDPTLEAPLTLEEWRAQFESELDK